VLRVEEAGDSLGEYDERADDQNDGVDERGKE
jgi:hypothetical protein